MSKTKATTTAAAVKAADRKKKDREAEAEADYRLLVETLAECGEAFITEDEVAAMVEAAGKTAADLDRDVVRERRRQELFNTAAEHDDAVERMNEALDSMAGIDAEIEALKARRKEVVTAHRLAEIDFMNANAARNQLQGEFGHDTPLPEKTARTRPPKVDWPTPVMKPAEDETELREELADLEDDRTANSPDGGLYSPQREDAKAQYRKGRQRRAAEVVSKLGGGAEVEQ